MYSTCGYVASNTSASHEPKVDIHDPLEPQTTNSIVGSIRFISLAASQATRPYSDALFAHACHEPSTSLPKHQSLTPCGAPSPAELRRRCSDRVEPPGWLQYSTSAIASAGPRVPRLTARYGDEPACLHHSTNSSVPIVLGSSAFHAGSSRDGRSSRGPTPSSQLYELTKLPPG